MMVQSLKKFFISFHYSSGARKTSASRNNRKSTTQVRLLWHNSTLSGNVAFV
jgi:hypothetical protein